MAKTVLIVDDNAYIRRALCELFTREAEFKVCGEAANGRQALSKVLELHPDLIVMDLSMPEMNGLETARELLERYLASPLTPDDPSRADAQKLLRQTAGG